MIERDLYLVLAPILALAGGRDLTRGEFGAVILHEYAAVVQDYPTDIALEAVRRACEGETFKPSPHKVRESCVAVLEETAQKFLAASAAKVNRALTDIDRAQLELIEERDRKEWGQRKACEFFGIPWDEWERVRFGSALDRARVFPQWRDIEPRRKTDGLEMLIESMFDGGDLPRIGEEKPQLPRNGSGSE